MSVKINFKNFNSISCGKLQINYYIDDEACKAAQMMFGFSCNTLSVDGDIVPVIIMGNGFEKLSENAKMFMLCHEAGHINLGHLKTFGEMYGDNNIYNSLCRESTPTIEVEADSFAASIIMCQDMVWKDVIKIYDELIELLEDCESAKEQIIRRKELIEYCKPNIIESVKQIKALSK